MMSEAARVMVFALIALPVTLVATPLMVRLAQQLDFVDRPREYRKHARPTPFLGGTAVLLGFLAGAFASGAGTQLLVIVGCTSNWRSMIFSPIRLAC